jgi:hypothetical protein
MTESTMRRSLPRRPTLLAFTAVLVASSTPARAQVECNGVTCPVEDACYADECVPPCENDEFPCPAGRVCIAGPELDLRNPCANPGIDADCFCLPSRCLTVGCEQGWICSEQDGRCHDLCENVTCAEYQECYYGLCFGCNTLGCPNCHWCVGDRCVPDPCCGCPPDQVCDPDTATCVPGPCEEVGCAWDLFCCDRECVRLPCGAGRDGGSATDAAGPDTRGDKCGCHVGSGAAGWPLWILPVLVLCRRRRVSVAASRLPRAQ